MSSTIFILGAGASREAGAPLMADFLDAADELRRAERKSFAGISDFDLVFKALAALQLVHSKAALDIRNIESVFAAFEMAGLFGSRLGNLTEEEMRGLNRAIKSLIIHTLENRIRYPVMNKRAHPPPPYNEFISLITDMGSTAPMGVCIITFNYDMALDYALNFNSLRPDYSLDEGKDKPSGVPLLKLHGSLNWARCGECNAVIPWYLHEFFSRCRWDLWMDEPEYVRLDIAQKLSDFSHCGKPILAEPVIVPPHLE